MLDLPNDTKYMKEYMGLEVEKFNRGEMPKYHGLYRKKGDRFCSEVFFPCET
jgi:hypothetical protein